MDDQTADSIPSSGYLRAPSVSAAATPRVALTRGRVVAPVVFAAVATASLALERRVGAGSVPALVWAGLAAGAGMALLAGARRDPVRLVSMAWTGLLSAFGLACLILLAARALPDRAYGDGPMFATFVADGQVVPRWLIGSAAASAAHAAVWELPPVRARLPEALITPTAFLSAIGIAAMAIGTWGLSRRWPGQLAVLLPAMTPIWLLFASGYVEYYPLVAAAFVAALAWLFERPLEQRSHREMAVVIAVLPLLYIGFLPVAGLALVAWTVVRPGQAPRAIALAIGLAALVIVVCWPPGIVSYIRTLYAVLNFGDANLPPQYAGQVAGPASFMFTLEAVTSWAHARNVRYLLVWGGGWWAMPLLVAAATRAWIAASPRRVDVLRDARVWLGAALVAWQLYYLVFMLPRLGVRDDIDLFFTTYLTIAFIAGLLLDRTEAPRTTAWTPGTLACALAGLACAAPWLVWMGLPPAP